MKKVTLIISAGIIASSMFYACQKTGITPENTYQQVIKENSSEGENTDLEKSATTEPSSRSKTGSGQENAKTARFMPVSIELGFAHIACSGCAPLCQQGGGICSIRTREINIQPGEPLVLAGFDQEKCKMIIQFINFNNQPELVGPKFNMERDYIVPQELAEKLGGTSVTIPTGEYPITKTGNKHVIEFPLCQN